jgi:FG-GAP repeat
MAYSKSLWPLCLLFALAPAIPAASADHATTSAPSGEKEAAPVFRLGTAARPFGWSTAIADVNRDGRPDVVVADCSATRGRFLLDFAVSGEPRSVETVQTAEDSLDIQVADVDRDSDLDVVLTAAISGHAVGVWLNDGTGHFTRSTATLPATVARRRRSASDGGASTEIDAAEVPPRRDAALAGAREQAPTVSDLTSPVHAVVLSFVSRQPVSSAAPRAPPLL